MSCADEDCDHAWHYDSPKTLRGSMQRGLGYAAYLAPRDPDGAQLAGECLRRDHRWDWQVDDRIVYLARLVRDLHLDLAPLVGQMRACGPQKHYTEPDPTDDNQFDVAVGVLAALARSGDDHARGALRDYAADGVRWIDVLEQIAGEWPATWWDDLWTVAARRLRPDDAHDVLPGSGPWSVWTGRDPAIDAVLSAADSRIARARSRHRQPGLEEKATSELIAILGTTAVSRQAKISVLAQLRRREPAPELLGLADRVAELNLPFLGSTIRRLGPMALTQARTWAAQPGHPLSWTGWQILADHGDQADTPALLAAVRELDECTGWCGYDTLTEGLTRIVTTVGGAASVKDQLVRILRRLLHGSPHSYERTSYLTSLLALDTERTTQLLPLGLLDCEPGVRLLAAEHTPPTDDARQWLADLSRDPLEEDDVREAAGRRLHPAATAPVPSSGS